MSDHLLRLAKLVQSLAARTSGHELYDDARRLVDDLEAASQPTPNSSQVGSSPAPERRTITREEFTVAISLLENARSAKWGTVSHVANYIAAAWRLTVEDA